MAQNKPRISRTYPRAASSGAAIRTRLRRLHSAIYRQRRITPCDEWNIGELVDRLRAKFGERDVILALLSAVQFRSQGRRSNFCRLAELVFVLLCLCLMWISLECMRFESSCALYGTKFDEAEGLGNLDTSLRID